jgi:hypothetical protein
MEKEATNWEYRFDLLEAKMLEHFQTCSVKEITTLISDVKYVTKLAEEIKHNQELNYVTKEKFDAEVKPLKKIVYSVIGLILAAVGGAILKTIIVQ